MSDDTPPAPGGQADPADGPDDTPYRFERSHAVGEVPEAFDGLAARVATETLVPVAARPMLRRDQGRLAFGTLPGFRLQGRYDRFMSRFAPKIARKSNFSNFTTLLSGSRYDDEGITYDLPDHVYAEESSKW